MATSNATFVIPEDDASIPQLHIMHNISHPTGSALFLLQGARNNPSASGKSAGSPPKPCLDGMRSRDSVAEEVRWPCAVSDAMLERVVRGIM